MPKRTAAQPARETRRYPTEAERDDPVSLPPDEEAVLRALLAVKPDDEPADENDEGPAK